MKCNNTAFAGLSCVLMKAMKLIPSKPAWCVQNPTLRVHLVLGN